MKEVFAMIEGASSHGRGMLHGIAEYMRKHEGWICRVDPWGRIADVSETTFAGMSGIITQVERPEIASTILKSGIPAVNIYSSVHCPACIPSVLSDDRGIGEMAARQLIESGFRHFAYLTISTRELYWAEHMEGFRKAIESHFAERPDAIKPDIRTLEIHYQWSDLPAFLRALPKPVGLLTCNDDAGRRAVMACHRLGISVPEEIAVIGIDNDELFCEFTYPPLSSVSLASERIGYEAAALLDALMNGQPAPTEPIRIPPLGVVTRQSSDILMIEDPHVREALRFIRRHIDQPITVDSIMEVIPISRRTLEMRFRKVLGRSPHEEIRHARIERAKRLLSETSLSIADIAEQCAFCSAAEFSMAFKRQTGKSPTHFRQQFNLA